MLVYRAFVDPEKVQYVAHFLEINYGHFFMTMEQVGKVLRPIKESYKPCLHEGKTMDGYDELV